MFREHGIERGFVMDYSIGKIEVLKTFEYKENLWVQAKRLSDGRIFQFPIDNDGSSYFSKGKIVSMDASEPSA